MTYKALRFFLFFLLPFWPTLSISCGSRPQKVYVGIALTPQCHYGVQLALREINAAGGIQGVPMDALGLDWQRTAPVPAQETLAWAERFASTGNLIAVIGHVDSVETLTAAGLYNQAEIPNIVTLASNPAITNVGEWTYRLCLSDKKQGPALAEYAVRKWGKRKIAVIYANDDYGRGLSEEFVKRARELGAEITAGIIHRNVLGSDDKEYLRARLERLRREGEPELIVLFQKADAGAWTLNTIREVGIGADLLGGEVLGAPGFTRDHRILAEGMRFTQYFYPKTDYPRCAAFVKNYKELARENADTRGALAYDAIYLVRDAILEGGFSRRGVKSYLDRIVREKTRIDGIGGVYSIGPDHDAQRMLHIVEASGGMQRLIETVAIE
jgi:branched-chain amino acid transport system substrate-binding protein